MTGLLLPRTGAEVQGRISRNLRQEIVRPVLFDTTQLALQGAISGTSQRQTALAANLANADTPGYRRVDVDFHSALSSALAQPGTAASALSGMSFAPQVDASAGAVQADGNTVDSDSESAQLAENALEQQTAVEVAQARLHILQSAIGASGH
jgi:flagellar basal-body rod protein FlgB